MNQSLFILSAFVLVTTILGANHLNEKIDEFSAFDDNEPSCHSMNNNDLKILGNTEVIHFGDKKSLIYIAKIDSGARTSSLHALNIETSLRSIQDLKGRQEVMFVSFDTEDDDGNKQRLEKMVSRIHQVKSASGVSTRYFFEDTVWINNKKYEIEINLADRSHLSKKMILGKNLINQGYLIDTSKAFVMTDAIVSN